MLPLVWTGEDEESTLPLTLALPSVGQQRQARGKSAILTVVGIPTVARITEPLGGGSFILAQIGQRLGT